MASTGRPETVSINLVAKEAGLSWGSVQNLFGDSDGFWAAVVERILRDAPGWWAEPVAETVAGRVAEVVDFYNETLGSPYTVAFETIRDGLPRPRSALEVSHPRTAAALSELEVAWTKGFLTYFAGLDVDQEQALDVATLLIIAVRGLRDEETYGHHADLDRLRSTLITAMSSHLGSPPGSPPGLPPAIGPL
ncbi:TetR/AcrR family transcriptional regulator [Nocardioides sp. zg-536]|uniref:TetR/AcrR family transcriptional regulator n=1 Tax=Nocardioides faecalis TaxID=2803858 RepID=A0A938Y5W8_9ACTN|nr:TetR/AcrR family transcriptional regulator [Nocardioides faecalis]MBM9459830.1 TetR/AcrR family transcriptional regulator [Nocardioides faecalis]MBS4754461.1 TetR/AcrR family transcriptional regulator [Nocardioides faecalis]QVI58929.1 TetR/AcrR family transcriptional regulator [Nocardioides faecalis]